MHQTQFSEKSHTEGFPKSGHICTIRTLESSMHVHVYRLCDRLNSFISKLICTYTNRQPSNLFSEFDIMYSSLLLSFVGWGCGTSTSQRGWRVCYHVSRLCDCLNSFIKLICTYTNCRPSNPFSEFDIMYSSLLLSFVGWGCGTSISGGGEGVLSRISAM